MAFYKYWFFNSTNFNNWCMRNILWSCYPVGGCHWTSLMISQHNTGSGNGLVSSGNKLLPQPILTQYSICHHMTSQGHNVLITQWYCMIQWDLFTKWHFLSKILPKDIPYFAHGGELWSVLWEFIFWFISRTHHCFDTCYIVLWYIVL